VNQLPSWKIAKGFHQKVMVNVVKTPFNIGVYNPFLFPMRASYKVNFTYGIMGTFAGTKIVATAFKDSLPRWG
jgi:hypothetical protein